MWRIFVLACCFWGPTAAAEIRFEEVTEPAGISHAGQSYGASWGDLDSDGWPDLWVGNHDSKPSLYRNDGHGHFVDVIDRVWAGNPSDDTHGAQWADFDNDGDQDLVEVVGALTNPDGTLCLGCGKNHLWVNESGALIESAARFGLDATGFARTPLWFDADRDGRLDLLVVNTRQGESTSALYRQQPAGGFVLANEAFGFKDDRWSRLDQYRGLLANALRFKFDEIGLLQTRLHMESAQLARVLDDGSPALVLVSSPSRVYSLNAVPFADETAVMGFPALDDVNDVAIEDFDGDGDLDMYLARGPYLASDVVQADPLEIKGTLTGSPKAIQTVTFRSAGPLEFEIHPTFLTLSEIYIGAAGTHPQSRRFTLSSNDAGAAGPAPAAAVENGGVSVVYNARSGTWTLTDASQAPFVDFIVHGVSPIDAVHGDGFQPFREEGVDALLLRTEGTYRSRPLLGDAGTATSCFSIAAGDFDNDMDQDLYLVCTGPLLNLPNRLLENDGVGNFTQVTDAGGASGSMLGRGDVVATADYDGDGFLDLFVTNGMDPTSPFVADGPHQLFRNRGNANHWLEIDLAGVESNRDSIGAVVTVAAGGITQTREQRGGMHRATQNYQRLHWGLGNQTRVDRVEVRWPSGRSYVYENVAANRILQIREDGALSTVGKTARE